MLAASAVTHYCDITAPYRGDAALFVYRYSQAFSSMRASLRLGCAIGVPRDPALDAPVAHGRTAPPLIECGGVSGHRSAASSASVTNMSCQYPVCAPLAVLNIAAVIRGRPSDCGPRRDAATATVTHSGYYAACCALQIHRLAWRSAHGTVRLRGDASEWRCAMYQLVYCTKTSELRVLDASRYCATLTLNEAPHDDRGALVGHAAAFPSSLLALPVRFDTHSLLSASAPSCLP